MFTCAGVLSLEREQAIACCRNHNNVVEVSDYVRTPPGPQTWGNAHKSLSGGELRVRPTRRKSAQGSNGTMFEPLPEGRETFWIQAATRGPRTLTTSLPVARPASMSACASAMSSMAYTRWMGTLALSSATASRNLWSTGCGRSVASPP